MSSFIDTLMLKVSNFILQGVDMSDKAFIEREIQRWKTSPRRMMQIKGHLYYDNEHDILHRRRMVIGEKGELVEVGNIPNNRLIDNQYAKLVNQKTNYLLGKPFVIEGGNKNYVNLLKEIFNRRFMKTLKAAGKATLNSGISWLYPYYDEYGAFSFRMFPGYEVLPFWKDTEHTILDAAVRLYVVMGYQGTTPVPVEKVEVYDRTGVHRYILDGFSLIPDLQDAEDNTFAYTTMIDGEGRLLPLNWEKIPLIPIKYNDCEIPLLQKVKPLQDGINLMLSNFENNMEEDARNTVLVIKNLDGQDLGEFRRNLATYGAVKVLYDGEVKGGVETLQITVNADNYKAIIEIFKRAIIENGMGFDAKDDRLSGNPNQMNIQSMYSDIELDANDMETELQASFEEVLWFVNAHLSNSGYGDFDNEHVEIIFNRDMLMNEGEIIDNCQKSLEMLSDETIISMHPWVTDPQKELERLKKQKESETVYNPFESTNSLKTQTDALDGVNNEADE